MKSGSSKSNKFTFQRFWTFFKFHNSYLEEVYVYLYSFKGTNQEQVIV